jgi:hypothetical protein
LPPLEDRPGMRNMALLPVEYSRRPASPEPPVGDDEMTSPSFCRNDATVTREAMIRYLQWKVNVEEDSQLELKAKASIEPQALSSLAFLYMDWRALPLSPYKAEGRPEMIAWYVFESQSRCGGKGCRLRSQGLLASGRARRETE